MGYVNVLVPKGFPCAMGECSAPPNSTDTLAAYDGLPAGLKARLADATATHDWITSTS